jgi:uncharacterized protein (DUF1015 family)
MADIQPFCGYRYAVSQPEDLGLKIAPPYDMIDGFRIDELYAKDATNVVRIIQNKKEAADTENKDRHKRANAFLKNWIATAVLKQDETPSMYAYTQKFSLDQEKTAVSYTRTAIIALVKLVDYEDGIVFPHEYTLTGPKADRYELFQETNTQSELIFGIVPDAQADLYKTISSCVCGKPVGTFSSEGNVLHSLYKVQDSALIASMTKAMKERTILIADGHHRYETCLKYFRDSKNPKAGYAVMALVSMADPGLVIRPFHRLIHSSPGTITGSFIDALQPFFSMSKLGPASFLLVENFLNNQTGFEMIFCDHVSQTMYGLNLAAGGETHLAENGHGMSALWNRLNVSEINSIVVNNILGLPLDGTVLHDLIDYVNDPHVAFKDLMDPVNRNKYRGGFFIKPLDITTVNSIVSGGERMPQKSTNFFPKCFSGLVFYSMENNL